MGPRSCRTRATAPTTRRGNGACTTTAWCTPDRSRRSIDAVSWPTRGAAWEPAWPWRWSPAAARSRPRVSAAIHSRSAWRPAIPLRTASCCGPGRRPSLPIPRSSARRSCRCAGASPRTTGCTTSSSRASPSPRRSWRTPSTSRSRACTRAVTTSISSTSGEKKAPSATSARRRPSTRWSTGFASPSRRARTGRAASTPRIATCCRTTSTSCCTSATTPTSMRSGRTTAAPPRPASRRRPSTCARIGCVTRSTSSMGTCRPCTRASRSWSSGTITRSRTTTPASRRSST